MRKDLCELYLLELRQGVKETEKQFKTLACIDLFAYRRLNKLKELIRLALIETRIGNAVNKEDLIKFMEG